MPRKNRPSPIASISFDSGGLVIPGGGLAGLALNAVNALSGTMTVNFTDGSVHDYYDVPLEVFAEFEASGPSGGYFNANIRGTYD